MTLLPYERELVDFWLTLKPRTVRVLPRTGLWIKKRLEFFGQDYCYRAWKEHQRFIIDAATAGVQGLRYSPYSTFRWYWAYLGKYKLIIPVRIEPSLTWKPRVYYALNPDVPDRLWDNIYREERRRWRLGGRG